MYTQFLKQIEEFIFIEDTPQKADIIFVPGNGYPQMAELAASLYHDGYAPYILPSGKYSITLGKFSGVEAKQELYNDEYQTEWDFLSHVLLKNNVPKQAILKEDQATFTYENAIFSRQVTNAAHLDIKKAILCCKTYHAKRSLMYYKLLYPDTEFFVCTCDVDHINRDTWLQSEEGIDAVTGECSRIVKQFSLMLDYESRHGKKGLPSI